MNIKKSILGSLFSMLLVSEMAAADWGDVYYCQMTNYIEITIEGEQINHPLGKFQFKLDQTKNAMVFGEKGAFANQMYELSTREAMLGQEVWVAKSRFSITFFNKGQLLFSLVGNDKVLSITADCDKF